ncbi:cell wall protein Ecm33 [Neonectria magnoliae]|uniref:Cell wall protein Ecm33 n=1 Tax=Neonectria magnoliae TaxID=2732573 RepID=A0ABR1IDM0_9HYPO
MHSTQFITAAIVAFGASAVSAASTCTKDIKVTEPTPVISCDVVDADITIDSDIAGDVVISGPKQIKGDFIVNNASGLISLSSTTINAISGTFSLQNLELLSKLEMASLKSVGEINMIKLPQLESLNFGTEGVTKMNSIQITDTFISDLSGLSVATVENFQIDNNKRMTTFDSDLVNITGQLIINNNGNNMEITMDKLELAAEIQISNVKSFSAPALTKITKSIKFDKNPEFKTFFAPNVTSITNDVSFINNKKLTNVSMPLLEKIQGGFTIQNNTAMETIDGFPLLESVSGGIILRGSFEKVELPALNDVKGSVIVSSTTDISDFCDFFDDLQKSDAIQGDTTCTSNNKKANDGEDGGESTRGNSSSSNGDDEDAAGSVTVSMTLLSLAGIAALAQLF